MKLTVESGREVSICVVGDHIYIYIYLWHLSSVLASASRRFIRKVGCLVFLVGQFIGVRVV